MSDLEQKDFHTHPQAWGSLPADTGRRSRIPANPYRHGSPGRPSEMSVARGGAVVDIPDFTSGKWVEEI